MAETPNPFYQNIYGPSPLARASVDAAKINAALTTNVTIESLLKNPPFGAAVTEKNNQPRVEADPRDTAAGGALNPSPAASLTKQQIVDGVTLQQLNGGAPRGFAGPADIWTKVEGPLLFPSDLTTTVQKFPFIGFWARKGAAGERCIFLPIPSGISFSDQMQYSAIDLGIMGSIVAKAATAAVNEGNVFSAAGGALGAGIGAAVNKIKSTNSAAIASLAAKMVGSDNLSNAIDFGARQVIAPNTNTAFQNSTVRQFQFSFKMMPKDRKEAKTITEIVKRFRQNMYPMGNDLILTYPPIWNIKFYADGGGANGAENTKLPGIYDCYLIGMSAVYNSSGNMFYADGHPIETDVQLTFEETRALTLADIAKLSEGRNA